MPAVSCGPEGLIPGIRKGITRGGARHCDKA